MSTNRKFTIPEQLREKFQSCYDTMHSKCPMMSYEAGIDYNPNSGEFTIENVGNVKDSLKNYMLEALKVCKAAPETKSMLIEKKVLKESDDATKNLAVNALKAVSETLDMLKQNVMTAQDKVRLMPEQGIIIQKLEGLSAQVEASIIDVSESITEITGEQTTSDIIESQPGNDLEEIHEDMGDDQGVEMDMDQALKNADKLKKFTDQKQNVIIKDDDGY